MTEIQEILLEILRGYDAVCKKHGINYFLTGGSSLGAMRHNGIIPWDDDIDTGILRSDWKKARPIIEKELPEPLMLVDRINYPSLRNPIVKILHKNSTVLYRANLADGCPKGQYVEVFMHDPVPASKIQEHKRDFLIYCELMTPYFTVFKEKLLYRGGLTDEELDIMEQYLKERERVKTEGLEKILDEYEEKLGQYTVEESDYMLLNWGVNACYYPIENFRGFKYKPFNDLMIPLPTGACDNLRIDYGNSWTDYPPEPRQMAHVTVGDNNICGDEYMKLINAQINTDKTHEIRLSQKEHNFMMIPEMVQRKKDMFDIQMRQAKLIDLRTENLKQLYDEGKYTEITEIFKDYIRLKKKIRNYTFKTDIRDESRDIIAKALVMLGRTTDAENIMDITRSMSVSDGNKPTVNNILRITKANSCFYDEMFEEAHKLIDSVEGDLKNALLLRKVIARLALAEGQIPEDAFAMAEEFPDDLEAMKIKADALEARGFAEEAEKLYDIVLEKTNNGMDILEITKKRAARNE